MLVGVLVAAAPLGCSSILGFEEVEGILSDVADGATSSTSSLHASNDAAGDAPSSGDAGMLADGASLPSASLSTLLVDFGSAECGGDPPDAEALTLSNNGDAAMTWSTAFSDTGPFHLATAGAGTLAAHTQVSLALFSDPVEEDDVPGTVDHETLTVTTSDPVLPSAMVTLQRTSVGAALLPDVKALTFTSASDAGLAPQMLSFAVHNSGNRIISITANSPASSAFTVDWASNPDPASIDVGGSTVFTVTYDPSVDSTVTADSLSFDLIGPLCGDPPVVQLLVAAVDGGAQ